MGWTWRCIWIWIDLLGIELIDWLLTRLLVDYIFFVQKQVVYKLNENEVASVKYMTPAQLRQLIADSKGVFWYQRGWSWWFSWHTGLDPDSGVKLTPWFRMICEHFLFKWWEGSLLKGQSIPQDHETIHQLSWNVTGWHFTQSNFWSSKGIILKLFMTIHAFTIFMCGLCFAGSVLLSSPCKWINHDTKFGEWVWVLFDLYLSQSVYWLFWKMEMMILLTSYESGESRSKKRREWRRISEASLGLVLK